MQLSGSWSIGVLFCIFGVLGALGYPSVEASTYVIRQRANVPSLDVPVQCQPSCQEFADVENACSAQKINITCLCGNTAVLSVVNCVECIASLPNADPAFLPDQQTRLNNIASDCSAAGHPVGVSVELTSTSNGHKFALSVILIPLCVVIAFMNFLWK